METYEIHLTRHEIEDLLSMLQILRGMSENKHSVESEIMALEYKPLFFINFLDHLLTRPVIGAGPQVEEIPHAS